MDAWLMTTSPDPAPECVIEIRGMPRSMLGYHQVRLGGRSWRAEPLLRLPRPDVPTPLTLHGPRFRGDRRVSSRDCDAGPVELRAVPRPARLVFEHAPTDAVAQCQGCPGVDPRQHHFVESLPEIPMTGLHLVVELTLMARGHRTRSFEVQLLPGENRIDARLPILK